MRNTYIILAVAFLINTHNTVAQDYWQPVGLQGLGITAMAIASNNYVVALSSNPDAQGEYLFVTKDNGATWEAISSLISAPHHEMFFDLNDVLVLTGYDEIYFSTDFGETWSDVYLGPDEQIMRIALRSNNEIYAWDTWGKELYRSSDLFNTWTVTQTPFTTVGDSNIVNYDMKVAPNGDVYISAAPIGFGVLRSQDGGVSWTTSYLPSVLTGGQMGLNPATGHIYYGGDSLAVSEDDGDTWQRIHQYQMVDFAFGPGSLAYAVKYWGVTETADQFANYTIEISGLDANDSRAVVVSSDGYLYVGCSQGDKGVFRTVSPVFTGVEEKKEIEEIQVYPNPASESLSFKLKNGMKGIYTLTLFNATGQSVVELLDLKGAEIQVDISALSSGLYTYTLDFSGGHTLSGNVTIVR